MNIISDIYKSCKLIHSSTHRPETELDETTVHRTGYYLDGCSGRGRITTSLLLKFNNRDEVDIFLESGAIARELYTGNEEIIGGSSDSDRKNAKNVSTEGAGLLVDTIDDTIVEKDDTINEDLEAAELWGAELATLGEAQGDVAEDNASVAEEIGPDRDEINAELTFQCLCMSNNSVYGDNKSEIGNEESTMTVVEAVIIKSTSISGDMLVEQGQEGNAGIIFDLEIVLRAPALPSLNKKDKNEPDEMKTQDNRITNDSGTKDDFYQDVEEANIRLEIKSVLSLTSPTHLGEESIKKLHYQDSDVKFYDSIRNDNSNQNNAIQTLYPIIDNHHLGLQALESAMGSIHAELDNSGLFYSEDIMQNESEQTASNSHYPNDDIQSSLPTSLFLPVQLLSNSLTIILKLVPPLHLSIREIAGEKSSSGATLVSLLISHSNQLEQPVSITNIALHPGHSRLVAAHSSSITSAPQNSTQFVDTLLNPPVFQNSTNRNSTGKSMPGGQDSVINMSQHVRWGFASGTALSLPLTLNPYEAIATVIQIDAGENLIEQCFESPICVCAVVGHQHGDNSDQLDENGSLVMNSLNETLQERKNEVMVSANAKWTTARIAIGTTDAFRIDMTLCDSRCFVGAQVVVSLRVMNLSNKSRDLMLLIAKDKEESKQQQRMHLNNMVGYGGTRPITSIGSPAGIPPSIRKNEGSVSQSVQNTVVGAQSVISQPMNVARYQSVNSAVVSEVNSYTFGVWGLSGDDDGTVRYSRDHELLAVDAALLLGEVKGQHSIEAELRFVPLREGTLDVPDLKLYDRLGRQWFNCVHKLKIVASSKQ